MGQKKEGRGVEFFEGMVGELRACWGFNWKNLRRQGLQIFFFSVLFLIKFVFLPLPDSWF